MKNNLTIILAIFIAAVFMGCKGNNGSLPGEVNFDKDASYALGMNIGADLRNNMINSSIYPILEEFLQGMKDGITDSNMRFELSETTEIINAAFEAAAEKRKTDAQEKENTFLAENAKKSGINITESGLQYEIVLYEEGPKPGAQDTVSVNYNATFIDGTPFDSTAEGQPQDIGLNQVIEGWREGLQLMSIGSKYIFYIPSAIGYGEQGMRDWNGQEIIPPFATLIFDVELLEIKENTGE